MPIMKSIQAPNGATVTFHKAVQAAVDIVSGTVAVNVASWSTEDDHNAGSGLVWMWSMDMAKAALADIDGALALAAPFSGGTVVSDQSATLATEKVRAWARIKSERDAAIAVGFTWNGSTFDSDDLSIQRIQGAVQMATLSAAAGQPFSIQWTLADNSTRMLSGPDMVAVGLALGAFVARTFATGVSLRQAIDAAMTNDEVRSITWAAS
jgi:hypothetical protein